MIVHLLIVLLLCILVWIACPRLFQLAVGFWVGAAAGGFAWALVGMLWITTRTSWAAIGFSFVGFMVVGIVAGCAIATKG